MHWDKYITANRCHTATFLPAKKKKTHWCYLYRLLLTLYSVQSIIATDLEAYTFDLSSEGFSSTLKLEY